MTANQIIKKLAKAGIDIANISKHSRTEIEINANDWDATEELKNKALAVVPMGGSKTGYGAWILSTEKVMDLGEYGDKSSRWHY